MAIPVTTLLFFIQVVFNTSFFLILVYSDKRSMFRNGNEMPRLILRSSMAVYKSNANCV